MQDFFNSFTFIIAFLIMCLVINMAFGDTVLTGFLTLVLFSMIILNANDFINMLQKTFK